MKPNQLKIKKKMIHNKTYKIYLKNNNKKR